MPAVCGSVRLHPLFDAPITLALEQGIRHFDRQIHGFADTGILTGVESRSSFAGAAGA